VKTIGPHGKINALLMKY